MKKTILFGAPKTFNISDQIVKNLEFLGFEVIDASYDQKYKYKNLKERATNLLRKTFLKDKDYKNILRFNAVRDKIYKKIETAGNVDFAFIIRPDIFPIDFVAHVNTKANLMVGYQWDGLSRFPFVSKYFSFFDRFFVFDPVDVYDRFLPLTNFYFDYPASEVSTKKPKAYFIGSYFPDRAKTLNIITKILQENNIETDITISTNKRSVKRKFKKEPLTIVKEKITFEQNLQNVKDATILFDLGNNIHNGLSFRTFEALGGDKKLITDNKLIKQYDFYHPNNIFLIEDGNYGELPKFLKLPYLVNQELKHKYSFTNWIHYVLDLPPYTPITLPSNSTD